MTSVDTLTRSYEHAVKNDKEGGKDRTGVVDDNGKKSYKSAK